jgi:hypothetical protein
MSVGGREQGVERILVKEAGELSPLWSGLFADGLPARIVEIIKAMVVTMFDACHEMFNPSPTTLQNVFDGACQRCQVRFGVLDPP